MCFSGSNHPGRESCIHQLPAIGITMQVTHLAIKRHLENLPQYRLEKLDSVRWKRFDDGFNDLTRSERIHDEISHSQTEPNRAKQSQTEPNRAKQSQTEPNTAKHSQTQPNRAKHSQTQPNTAKHTDMKRVSLFQAL